MKIAIHQPHYLPWLGYWGKLLCADIFVWLDTVQFEKNEWQNRNRLISPTGTQWLSVPVNYKFPMKINEVLIDNKHNWQNKHHNAIKYTYASAPLFKEYIPFWDDLYNKKWEKLTDLNWEIFTDVCSRLKIKQKIFKASDMDIISDNPDERLIEICHSLKADQYICGIHGPEYMDLEVWKNAGINVSVFTYGHPLYKQLYEPFRPYLGIPDLLFIMESESAIEIIKKGIKTELWI